MNSKEILDTSAATWKGEWDVAQWLAEIALQLAQINEQLRLLVDKEPPHAQK